MWNGLEPTIKTLAYPEAQKTNTYSKPEMKAVNTVNAHTLHFHIRSF